MPRYCCVPWCYNHNGHLFPKDASLQLKWRVAIRRANKNGTLWMPNLSNDVVCQSHFKTDDYIIKRKGKKLKPGSIPSVFPFTKTKSITPRLRRRTIGRFEGSSNPSNSDQNEDLQVGREEVVDDSSSTEDCSIATVLASKATVATSRSIGVNVSAPFNNFSMKNFEHNPKAILYYTGFNDYNHFCLLLRMLGLSAVAQTAEKFFCLTSEDQIFLTLIKLRQNKDFEEISLLFDVSVTTVSRVFQTWTMFMYSRMKLWPVWPTRKTINDTMPRGFKKLFPTTRVIIDATEIPIMKPTNVNLQSQTFSSYKNRNTVKVMVGITPRGAVSFISDCYPGSTSDRQVIEDSNLYKHAGELFDKGDSIMADRGIMVQDLFAQFDVSVNTPTPLRGKSQLDPSDVLKDRKVASKRIHVERVIALAKTYKILKHGFSPGLTRLCSQIVYVVFSLVNLRKCIVDGYA